MSRLHSSATTAAAGIFVAAALCCSFCQPFRPGAVCRAIPAQASFVFRANNLQELLESPVCTQLDKALGAGNSLKELLGTSDWTRLGAASEIAVADIPFRQAGQSRSWVAASWVGWRSPWLRWKFEHARDPNLRLIYKRAVWPVWSYEAPDIARGMSLTFALTDNLLLACLSESPTDICLLLDTYDQRNPSISLPKGPLL